MVSTPAFYDALCAAGLDFFAGVPDSLLSDFCAYLYANAPAGRHLITANEGNAVGMALGYHLATGRYGVVYMQNSGQGNAVNPLASLADPDVYGVPMLLIIGWRGEPGSKDEPQHVKQGKITLSLLDTLSIPYKILDETYAAQLADCVHIMKTENRPVALIVRKGTFSPCKLPAPAAPYPLRREDALSEILAALRPDEFVVSTTGKTSREIFELRERRQEGHDRDFLTVGGMGHTASIAYGMATGTRHNVYCIDGDGSFLMHMGGIGVIAQHPRENFKYILINNGAHESVGGQPTIAFSIDVPAVLKALGFERVYRAETRAEIAAAVHHLREEPLAALVVYTSQGARPDLGRPTRTPQRNKADIMERLQGGAQA